MRFTLASAAAAAATTATIASANLNILMTNDDGWASANMRASKAALEAQGHKCLIIGPLENQSGSGGTVDLPTNNVTESGGIYGLVEPGSSYYGYLDDPSIRYFNSTPAGCSLWGLKSLSRASDFFGGEKIDLVVSGPNDGPNLGPFVYSLSGTCGAAYAAVMAGTPAISFSAYNFTHRPYYDINHDDPYDSSLLAGEMVANLVSSMADGYDRTGDKPLLPIGLGLNVNFPYLNSSCSTPPYYLTRLNGGAYVDDFVLDEDGFPVYTDVVGPGIDTCHYGDCSLPGETEIVENHCQSSISVFDVDYDAAKQYAAPVQQHIKEYVTPLANRRMKRSMAEKLRKRVF